MVMKNKYLTTTQAAQLCHVTRFTIRNWINEGKLKSQKTAGGHRRVLREDFISFINANKIKSTIAIEPSEQVSINVEPKKQETPTKQADENVESIKRSDENVELKKQEDCNVIPNEQEAGNAVMPCWEFKRLNKFAKAERHNCKTCLIFKERSDKCFLLVRMFGFERVRCSRKCLKCTYFKTYYPEEKIILGRMSGVFHKGLYTSGRCLASIKNVLSRKKVKAPERVLKIITNEGKQQEDSCHIS